MSDRIMLGVVAIAIGSFLAVLLFLPFIAVSYRRRGQINAFWLIGWVALLIYAMALWTYTLMPLPQENYRCVGIQLTPFASLADMLKYPHASPGQLLGNPAVQQVAFNVMLFMPLGFLLRTMFRRGLAVSVVAGAGASLLIELTQRTGVWGLFPCPYRLLDVDDLLANTLGAMLGSITALVFAGRRSPRVNPHDPRPVTAARRLLAMACDALFLVLVGGMLAMAWRAWQMYVLGVPFGQLDQATQYVLASWVPLAVQLFWVLASGQTIGESVALLRGRPTRMPAAVARPLRFVAGIGGYGFLTATSFPLNGLLLFSLVSVSLIMAWTTRNHRGFAAVVAGIEIEDARALRGAKSGVGS